MTARSWPWQLGLVALAAAACASAHRATPPGQNALDPLEEVRHEALWAEVVPAPLPAGLPLMGSDGTDAAGYPRRVVDRAALRSLLVHREFSRLTRVLEEFQSQFEKDPRYEDRVEDAYEVLGYPHARERELIDAWTAATPRSFAPYLASAAFWERTGFLWRGEKYARETSAAEFGAMAEAFDRARADLKKATALRSRLQQADILLIRIEVAGGTRDGAVRAMEHGLSQCPSCFTLRREWLWALSPRWGGSLEAMEEFATHRADPGNPRHRILEGHVLLERRYEARQDGHEDEASSLLDRACAIGGDWYFFERRASSRRTPAGLDLALADLERANELHPGLPEVLSARARTLQAKGRLEDAARDLLYVLRAMPTSGLGNRLHAGFVEALDVEGWKEHLAGRAEASARLYGLAQELAPGDQRVTTHARLARAPVSSPAGAAAPAADLGQGKPTLVVRGVDEAGAPVPGARVAVTPGDAAWRQLRQLMDELTERPHAADAEGVARLSVAAGPQAVLAARPGEPLAGAMVGLAVPTTGVEVRLTVGGSLEISGHTLDSSGGPVKGVEVLAAPDLEAKQPRKVAAAVSAEDGSFTLRGVDGQGYLLLRPGEELMPMAKGGASGLLVRSQPRAAVRGRVFVSREDGPAQAAEQFTVRLGTVTKTYAAAAEGRFELPISQSMRGPLSISTEGRPAVQRIVDTMTKVPVDLGDVVVGPGRLLRGAVVDPDGYPVAGAIVSLQTGPRIAFTKRDGTFEASVASGPTDLRVSRQGWLPWSRNLRGDEQDLQIRLSAGATFKLLVVGEGDAPLAGAIWSIVGPDTLQGCITDTNGRCTFSGLPSADFSLWAQSAPSLGPNARRPPPLMVPVSGQTTSGVVLRWEAAPASLTIRIAGSQGDDPRTAPQIRLIPGSLAHGEAFDSDGNSRVPYYQGGIGRPIEHLPPGPYTVLAFQARPTTQCTTKSVVLRGGADLVVTLDPPAGSCRW